MNPFVLPLVYYSSLPRRLHLCVTVNLWGDNNLSLHYGILSILLKVGKHESASNFLDDLEMAFLVSGRDDDEVKLRAFPLVLSEMKPRYGFRVCRELRRVTRTH